MDYSSSEETETGQGQKSLTFSETVISSKKGTLAVCKVPIYVIIITTFNGYHMPLVVHFEFSTYISRA